jgi:P2-related tail formation protein
VTVSVPVVVDESPCGVLAADVDVRRFIDTVVADLREIPVPVALVNEADRVVASTLPSLSTGLPIRPRRLRNDQPINMRRHSVSGYGWSLVTLPQ